jgi:choline dehydrogenase
MPGSDVPDNSQRGSDAAWRTWIKNNFNSVSHPIGTCAMMKKSLGGRCLAINRALEKI